MKFKQLREEFGTLKTEADGVINLATTESRELTADEKTANERRFSRMTAIKAILDEDARFAKLALDGAPDAKGAIETPKDAPGRDEFKAGEGQGRQTVEAGKVDRAEFSKAMSAWANSGDMDRKFATITSATQSGALLPKEIGMPLVPTHANVFREALALHGMKPVSTSTTNAMTIPVLTASAGGAVAEDANGETENAPVLTGTIVLNVGTYQSGTAWFSNLSLHANDFDIVTYVEQDQVYALELGLEAAIAAGIIADAGVTQVVTSGTTTGFTYDDLVDLNRKLPKRYDRTKVIFLGQAAYSAAEKMKGDDGHPILNRDPQNQELMRFNGTPVLRCDNFEGLTANKCIGAVVSVLGFKLRDVTPQRLERYTQNQAKPDQTGFNLFGYHGYGYDKSAVAKLKTAAT